jgi:hypothetical protein
MLSIIVDSVIITARVILGGVELAFATTMLVCWSGFKTVTAIH